jgi:hypothetical protein
VAVTEAFGRVFCAALLALTLGVSGHARAAAQTSPPAVAPAAGEAPTQSAAAVEELPAPYADPARALALLLPRIAAEPRRIDLRLAAARELTALGVTEPSRDDRMARIDGAEQQARAAVQLDSLSAEAHYWLAAAFGLRADESGGLAEVSAAKSAYAETMIALRLDPLHPGAHHILGRLHAGALGLSTISRLIARGLGLGAVISTASWETAEEHLRIGATGDPDRWINAFELARLLLKRQRGPEAVVILKEIVARSPRNDLDRKIQGEAGALLASVPGATPGLSFR